MTGLIRVTITICDIMIQGLSKIDGRRYGSRDLADVKKSDLDDHARNCLVVIAPGGGLSSKVSLDPTQRRHAARARFPYLFTIKAMAVFT